MKSKLLLLSVAYVFTALATCHAWWPWSEVANEAQYASDKASNDWATCNKKQLEAYNAWKQATDAGRKNGEADAKYAERISKLWAIYKKAEEATKAASTNKDDHTQQAEKANEQAARELQRKEADAERAKTKATKVAAFKQTIKQKCRELDLEDHNEMRILSRELNNEYEHGYIVV